MDLILSLTRYLTVGDVKTDVRVLGEAVARGANACQRTEVIDLLVARCVEACCRTFCASQTIRSGEGWHRRSAAREEA